MFTHRYRASEYTGKYDRSCIDKHLRMSGFFSLKNNIITVFCGYKALTDGVFVTKMSINARISVWRSV